MDYASVIKRIVNAENEAQKSFKDALARRESLDQDINDEINAKKNEFDRRINRRINNLREQEGRFFAETKAALEEKHREEKDALEKSFEKNRSEWVERLFKELTAAE